MATTPSRNDIPRLLSPQQRKERKEMRKRAREKKYAKELNHKWEKVEYSRRYYRALVKNIGYDTTDRIAEEMLDGIFLRFNERNSDKTPAEQRKLLRRIVEKRQAQAIYAKTRRRDRKTAVAVTLNSSHCLTRLHRLRFVC